MAEWRDELERWLKPFPDRLVIDPAADVSALRCGIDRAWWPQRRSADGGTPRNGHGSVIELHPHTPGSSQGVCGHL
jgi:hypothetical protein